MFCIIIKVLLLKCLSDARCRATCLPGITMSRQIEHPFKS